MANALSGFEFSSFAYILSILFTCGHFIHAEFHMLPQCGQNVLHFASIHVSFYTSPI